MTVKVCATTRKMFSMFQKYNKLIKVSAFVSLLVGFQLVSAQSADAVMETTRMAVDSAGRVVLTNGANGRVRVRRFDEALTPMGNWNLVSTAGVAVTGIAVDGDDLILVAGWFRGELELDGQVLVSAGAEDLFFLLLDANGDTVAFDGLGSQVGERPLRVAVDVFGEFRVQGMVLTGQDRQMNLFTLGLGVNGEVLDLNMIYGPTDQSLNFELHNVVDGQTVEEGPEGLVDGQTVEEGPEGLVDGQTEEEGPEGLVNGQTEEEFPNGI